MTHEESHACTTAWSALLGGPTRFGPARSVLLSHLWIPAMHMARHQAALADSYHMFGSDFG